MMSEAKGKHGGPRPNSGRPKMDDPMCHVIRVRVTASQREAFDAIGGKDWLRATISAVKVPA